MSQLVSKAKAIALRYNVSTRLARIARDVAYTCGWSYATALARRGVKSLQSDQDRDHSHFTLTRQFEFEMVDTADYVCELRHRHPDTDGAQPSDRAHWTIGGPGSRQTICVCHDCACYLMNELSQLEPTSISEVSES